MDLTDFEGIDLTEKQIERQLKKIRKLLFDDYEFFEDGSYKGEVTEEVVQILQKNIPDEDEVDDIMFLSMVKQTALDISEYILDNIKGIDKRLVALYSYDFSNQSYNSIYSINLKIKDDSKDNPMYI